MDVNRQYGSADCGVFAFAYATALSLGENPEIYVFDQIKMQQHLISCLEARKLTMFPIKMSRRKKGNIKAIQTFQVYCSCRLPETKYNN